MHTSKEVGSKDKILEILEDDFVVELVIRRKSKASAGNVDEDVPIGQLKKRKAANGEGVAKERKVRAAKVEAAEKISHMEGEEDVSESGSAVVSTLCQSVEISRQFTLSSHIHVHLTQTGRRSHHRRSMDSTLRRTRRIQISASSL